MSRRMLKTASPKSRRNWDDDAQPAEEADPRVETAQEPPLVEDLDADEELDEEVEQETAAETEEESHGGGADDALGLYLRQMGAIPLLNREQELALARRRFRRSALASAHILNRVLQTFEAVLDGRLAVDPVIDVITSLGLSRER